MPNRHSSVIIVLFWTGMMSWYVHREVIPTWLLSASPDYQTLVTPLASSSPQRWLLYQGEDLIGRAKTRVVRHDDGSAELHNEAHFQALPIPPWLAGSAGAAPRMTTQARFQLDAAMQLRAFQVRIDFAGADPIDVRGTVEDRQLEVVFETGKRRFELPRQYFPAQRMMGDLLSPLGQLPPLRPGQSWSMSVVDPFTRQIGRIQAQAVGYETITWNSRRLRAMVVQYKGSGVNARAWVRADGLVLKQEISVLWSTVTFVREAPDLQTSSAPRSPHGRLGAPQP